MLDLFSMFWTVQLFAEGLNWRARSYAPLLIPHTLERKKLRQLFLQCWRGKMLLFNFRFIPAPGPHSI
jgi:hypothetical protein